MNAICSCAVLVVVLVPHLKLLAVPVCAVVLWLVLIAALLVGLALAKRPGPGRAHARIIVGKQEDAQHDQLRQRVCTARRLLPRLALPDCLGCQLASPAPCTHLPSKSTCPAATCTSQRHSAPRRLPSSQRKGCILGGPVSCAVGGTSPLAVPHVVTAHAGQLSAPAAPSQAAEEAAMPGSSPVGAHHSHGAPHCQQAGAEQGQRHLHRGPSAA